MRFALALLVGTSTAFAQVTPLLEVNLKSGEERRIDGEQSEEDADLDAMLADALGEGSATFSTKALDDIVKQISGELRRARPRSPATLLVFVSPGRTSMAKLQRMKEINVDLELIIDPCDRSVCLDSVATHIEIVGRAVDEPERDGGRYKLIFRGLTIRTATQFRDKEMDVHTIPMEDCVAAAKERGGGRAWVDRAQKQEERYEPWVSRAVARRCYRRRIELDSAPIVTRSDGQVHVLMRVNGERSRPQEIVMESMAAAVEGMRRNHATPPMQQIEVQVLQPGWKPRRFQAAGPSVAQWLDGRMEAAVLWKTYVREIRQRKGASEFDFSDEET